MNGDEKGLVLVNDLESEVAPPLTGLGVVPGFSWSGMKSESFPGSGRIVASSLDKSSIIPLAAASDAVMPLMTAESVRFRRLLSTKVLEKTCFRRREESTIIVRSIDHRPRFKSWTVPYLIDRYRKQNLSPKRVLHPPSLRS